MKARPQSEVQGRDFRAELLEREAKLRSTGGKEDAGKRALVDIDDDQSKKPAIEIVLIWKIRSRTIFEEAN